MGFVISFSFHVYISMLIVAIAIGALGQRVRVLLCRGVFIETGKLEGAGWLVKEASILA